jgi:phytoene dehydrogenase-like protein
MKERYAERVLQKIEQYAPGFRSRILERAVLSPVDLQRANANLVGGDSVSGSHHLDQFYLFRPVPGWSRYRTPVARLWMVGASTWPGGGLNATSGYLAAQSLLRQRFGR